MFKKTDKNRHYLCQKSVCFISRWDLNWKQWT